MSGNDTAVELRPVNLHNYYRVLLLELAPDQAHYLWSNGNALAEAAYVPDQHAEAIHAGGELVGLATWGRWHPYFAYGDPPDPGSYSLDHLMIAAPFQGRGHGRRALDLLLARIAGRPDCRRIVISIHRDNLVARGLYERAGFREFATGNEDDPLLELVVRSI